MRAEIFIRGAGAVTAAGTGISALARALADPDWRPVIGLDRPDAEPLPVAACREFTAQGHLPPLVARRLDRPARFLAVAAREALASLGDPLAFERDRVGVCAGTWNAGTEAFLEMLRVVFQTAPDQAPPMLFPSTVCNAPASQLGILERLGGPNVTLFQKQIGGIQAVVECGRLMRRGRADAMLACGVDEAFWLYAEGLDRFHLLPRQGRPGMLLGEGAASLAVTARPEPRALARVAGWGSASTPTAPYLYPPDGDGLRAACTAALANAGVEVADVDLLVSAANGLPTLARIEARAMAGLFGARTPAAIAPTERLGEGGFAGTVRTLIGVLAVCGEAQPAWAPPAHLAGLGCRSLADRPRTVLISGLAGGGAAIALVLTAA